MELRAGALRGGDERRPGPREARDGGWARNLHAGAHGTVEHISGSTTISASVAVTVAVIAYIVTVIATVNMMIGMTAVSCDYAKAERCVKSEVVMSRVQTKDMGTRETEVMVIVRNEARRRGAK